MNQRNLLIGIIVGICIGILTILFLVSRNPDSKNPIPSQTPQPTAQVQSGERTSYPDNVGADWETYSNTKYNYSIKFPAGWATIINTTPGSNKETLSSATSLDIFDSAAQKSYPEGVMTIQHFVSPPTLPGSWNKTEVSLAGRNVQKFEGDEKNPHTETYIIPQESGVLEIDIRYTPGDSIQKTFNAMLTTFSGID